MKLNKIYFILVALLAFISCTQEEDTLEAIGSDDTVKLSFTVKNANYKQFTRNTNRELEKIIALVFNSEGVYLSSQDVVMSDSKDCTITLPSSSNSRIIHFIGGETEAVNKLWSKYSKSEVNFEGKDEGYLLPKLQVENLDYTFFWNRIELANVNKGSEIGEVSLIRNHAKLELSNIDEDFELISYAVHDAADKGTIVSFDSKSYSFNTSVITEPSDVNYIAVEETSFIPADQPSFLFERRASYKNITGTGEFYLILKGKRKDGSEGYYKVLFVDNDTKESLPILRNYLYKVIVKDVKTHGYATLEEAMSNAPSSNALLDIKLQDYNKISDGVNTLEVSQIAFLFTQGGEDFDLSFTYKHNDSEKPDYSLISLDIIEDENKKVFEGKPEINQTLSADGNTIKGTVTGKISSDLPGYGYTNSAVVKVQFGQLVRYVNVRLGDKQQLNVVMDVSGNFQEDEVDLIFNIPEDALADKSLYPFDIRIDTKHLYPNVDSGKNSDLLLNTDLDGSYYYIYKVYKPGVQKVHFKRNLSVYTETIQLSSNYFSWNPLELSNIVEEYLVDFIMPDSGKSITTEEFQITELDPFISNLSLVETNDKFTISIPQGISTNKYMKVGFNVAGRLYEGYLMAGTIVSNQARIMLDVVQRYIDIPMSFVNSQNESVIPFQIVTYGDNIRINPITEESTWSITVNNIVPNDVKLTFDIDYYNKDELKYIRKEFTVGELRAGGKLKL